jgi:acyl-CoA thioesterase FadM
MNLWFRLIWYLLTAWRRPTLEATHAISTLDFRVWPTDLDVSMHMNNGRYLTLMDIGRLDFLVRTGLWRPLLRHRWTPIASGIAIRFRRELRGFERIKLETRLLTWSDVTVVMEQMIRFRLSKAIPFDVQEAQVAWAGPVEGQVLVAAVFRPVLEGYEAACRPGGRCTPARRGTPCNSPRHARSPGVRPRLGRHMPQTALASCAGSAGQPVGQSALPKWDALRGRGVQASA